MPSRHSTGLSVLKKIAYFLCGTVWVVVDGLPVGPVGLVALLGVFGEKKKLATVLLVLGGCALGAIGTGFSIRTTTDPPRMEFHVGIGLHPKFNEMLARRQMERSGVLDEGRALAEQAIGALREGDVQAFRACFDPIVFTSDAEVEAFFRTFSEKLGTIESFEYAQLDRINIIELKKVVPLLRYEMHTNKAGPTELRIGLHKIDGRWRLLSFHV
jgi:hypothetical protein